MVGKNLKKMNKKDSRISIVKKVLLSLILTIKKDLNLQLKVEI